MAFNPNKRKLIDVKSKSSDERPAKPDWKKLKKEKKELKEKRKKSDTKGNDTYEIGFKAKQIWEELRRCDITNERKDELCAQLFFILKGKLKSVIFAHDTVRVIETLLSVGGEQYRTLIFDELKHDIVLLSKCKYSRFFVLKLIKYGTKEQKKELFKAITGKVVDLMKHKIACEVIELAYNDYANAEERSSMLQEFYGPKFRYFKENLKSLEEALEQHPEEKMAILSNVHNNLLPLLEKGVFTNSIIHTLLKEYLMLCNDSERIIIIDHVKENLLPIIHTRDGSRVAMLCLWHGTPKDRKTIIRSFKGHFIKIALEEYGHLVIFAAIDCVDDTVFLSKAMLAEFIQCTEKLSQHAVGKKVLQYIVSPRNGFFFSSATIKLLAQGDDIGKFKKEREMKYKELRNYASLSILTLIKKNILKWSKDPHHTIFISAALKELSGNEIVPIFKELANIFNEYFHPDNAKSHFLETSHVYKMLVSIISHDKQRFSEDKHIFSKYFLENANTVMESWSSSNRGCFIFVKLLETEIEEIVQKVTTLCDSLKSKLETLHFVGARVLLGKLNNE